MNALPNRSQHRRRPKMDRSRVSRGLSMSGETINFIPADFKLHPLRDQMIVEPLDVVYSRYLIVKHHTKPLRGMVKAIGPGHYATQYDHHEKHKRTKAWAGMHFRPTEVKVGDIVHLGSPQEGDGYAFETFYWGDTIHLHCREADVAGIET